MTRERLPRYHAAAGVLSDDLPSSETKPRSRQPARPEFSLQEQEAFEARCAADPFDDEFARTAERAQANSFFR